jgi:Spy/CpxP family protein refolding chaperone
MNKPWKLVLLLTGIFLAGGVVGSLSTVWVGRRAMANRSKPDQWAPMHLKRMTQELDLQPAQVEQLKPIVRRRMEELGRVRSRSMTESRTVMEAMERDVAEQLTPEQRAKFDKMNQEMRERFRRFMPERGGRPPGGRPPGGPGSPEGGADDRPPPPRPPDS